MSSTSAPAAAARRTDLAHWVIRVAGAIYVLGIALLAAAVYVELPGFLSAYGDPEAWWPILVQVLAGGTAFLTWVRVNRRTNRPFAVVLLGLGILTVVALAIPSYSACPDEKLSAGWSVITRVVGLITNNYAIDQFNPETTSCDIGGVPLALQFARLAQLLVLLVAFTSAVTALLRTQVDRVRVRWSPRLSLVLGADTTSASLLPALAADAGRHTLAVVTNDPLAPWVGQARAAGWRVVVTDPRRVETMDRLLGRPGRRHALSRLAVLASDSTESQRLMTVVQTATDGRRAVPGNHPVRALIRMDEAWQAEDWRRRYLDRIPDWIVDTISENEVTARLLVDHMVERGVDQVLLAGQSDLTFAVVAELAQRGREHELDPSRPAMAGVTIVGESADQVLEEHVLSQRRFGNSRLDRVRAETRLELDEVVASAVDEYVAPALVFSGDVSVADQRLAARLGATHPGLLVYSRHAEVIGLGADPLMAQVRAFGTTLDAGTGRPVDSWERIARLVHEKYVRDYPDPDDPARRPWNELAPFYRESNVRQVLTVLGSAVAVGRSWGASGRTASPPSPEQLDEMARREHESWLTHLHRNDWTWGSTRDRQARKHPDLLPWDALSDESRDKTRKGVLETLALLETLGYRSIDDPYSTWVRFRRRGEVRAVRRNEPWTWTTSDGTVMHANAGDWEVIDDDGSTRSISPSIFERTHESVDGDRWRRTGEIRGRRARPGEVVHSLEGTQTARPGQWVLRGVEGEEWLVPAEHLETAYDRIDDPSVV
ncbi:MAG TPA: RyR domain-containing protein [Nocardioides sp.]|uniref:RyR domain-containing protein n=1 Tax=Nocardioides sp. TaxID=35761 RepID=UPI002E3127EB|nr:RyR domain-containing protein [Nocardioides sp.]HEX5087446.1 RyR domain-containing protein [Nocardioides sp.]